MQMELLLIAGGTVAAAGLGAAVYLLARRPKPKAEEPVEMEVLDFDPTPGPSLARGNPAPTPPPAPSPHAAAAPARPALPAAPPTISPVRSHPQRAPAMVLTRGVQMRDETPQRPVRLANAPAPRPAMRDPPPMKTWAQQTREELPSPIPSEWARRQVGPAEPGRTKGVCGGCGAALSVSDTRPLRIACPVCGRTKLLAA